MNINNLIGIEYDINADFDIQDSGVNCNGLVYTVSEAYRDIIDSVYENKTNANKRKMLTITNKRIYDRYKKVDFDQRQKGSIIVIRQKGMKIWNHVGYLVSNDLVLHSTENDGVIIEHISSLLYNNKEFLIFSETNNEI